MNFNRMVNKFGMWGWLTFSLLFILNVGCRETLIDRIDDLAKAPGVIILKPINTAVFIENDLITFECKVRDNQDDSRDLNVQWESDVDGVLYTKNPRYDDGIVKFETRDLSLGTHIVEVTVTDTDGNTGIQSTEVVIRHIPVRPVIDSVSNVPEGLKIFWSKSVEATFKSYKLWRLEPYELLFEVGAQDEYEFIDTDVLVGNAYRYALWAHIASGDSTSSPAASASFVGQSIPLGNGVKRMLLDPVRPLLYILSDQNSELLVVNTETREIIQTVVVSYSASDLSISLDNTELFVAQTSGNRVSVYDMDPLSLNKSFRVDITSEEGLNKILFGVEYMSGNFLACAAESKWGNLNLAGAEDGNRADFYHQSMFEPDLATSPDKTILFAGERGLIDSKIYKLQIVDSTFQIRQSRSFDKITKRLILLSGDGEYIFYGPHKISSSDIRNSIGSFEEDVLASNQDGSIVLGVKNILNGSTFETIRPYANTNISHAVFDALHDSFIIYVKATNSLAIIELD